MNSNKSTNHCQNIIIKCTAQSMGPRWRHRAGNRATGSRHELTSTLLHLGVTSGLQRWYRRYLGGVPWGNIHRSLWYIYFTLLSVAGQVERLEFNSQSFINKLKSNTENQRMLSLQIERERLLSFTCGEVAYIWTWFVQYSTVSSGQQWNKRMLIKFKDNNGASLDLHYWFYVTRNCVMKARNNTQKLIQRQWQCTLDTIKAYKDAFNNKIKWFLLRYS